MIQFWCVLCWMIRTFMMCVCSNMPLVPSALTTCWANPWFNPQCDIYQTFKCWWCYLTRHSPCQQTFTHCFLTNFWMFQQLPYEGQLRLLVTSWQVAFVRVSKAFVMVFTFLVGVCKGMQFCHLNFEQKIIINSSQFGFHNF